MHKFLFFLICSLLVWASSCNSSTVYEKNIEFSDANWSKASIQKFTFEVPDTSHLFNIELKITNNDDYQYSNVYLFSNIIFPDKIYARDTIEFFLADEKGEWTGSGMKNHTNTYMFKSNIRFPKIGKYTFTFEQAMRCVNKECTLNGIQKIGLRIIRKQ